MRKTLRIAGLGILAVIILTSIINQFVDRQIKTEIMINASDQEVWEVLMDHGSYPDWNPFVKRISGSAEVGDNLSVTIQSEGNAPMDFQPEVLVNDMNHEFRWKGKLGVRGIFDGEHYFIIQSEGSNRSRFVHGEIFTGLLSGLLMKMIGEDTKDGFQQMNKALKERVESLSFN